MNNINKTTHISQFRRLCLILETYKCSSCNLFKEDGKFNYINHRRHMGSLLKCTHCESTGIVRNNVCELIDSLYNPNTPRIDEMVAVAIRLEIIYEKSVITSFKRPV